MGSFIPVDVEFLESLARDMRIAANFLNMIPDGHEFAEREIDAIEEARVEAVKLATMAKDTLDSLFGHKWPQVAVTRPTRLTWLSLQPHAGGLSDGH